MRWIWQCGRRWLRRRVIADDDRRRLEDWVRLRLQIAGSDPMIAFIGATGRLTEAGMDTATAVDTVLRINDELNRRAAED